MMSQEDREDLEIREMFARAREADRTLAPSYERMVTAPRPPVRHGRRIGLASVGLAATAAMAAWLVLRAPSPPLSIVDEPAPIPSSVAQAPSDPAPAPPSPPAPSARSVFAQPKQHAKTQGSVVGGAVGGVAGAATGDKARPAAPPGTLASNEGALLKDVPIPGRFYQNVLTLAPGVSDDGKESGVARGSRVGEFKIMLGGVTNVDPLTGLAQNAVSPDSIEEIEVVTTGAGVAYGRAQGGYKNVVNATRKGEEQDGGFNTESYAAIRDNPMQSARENPLSTFSIDVDTASYSNVRRFLKEGRLPPRDAVRVEEMINYFPYDDPAPTGAAPFSANVEIASCPWNPEHRLARIGLRGREIVRGESKGSNLVFLIDVSGSMDEPNKLPLLQKSLGLLVDELEGSDEVAIVVYAGASGVVLAPTPGSAKAEIREALDRLQAGGGTNGGAGLALAYKLAREHFIAGGVNRVILATDGDFNLGVTTDAELLALIEKDAHDGIFLSVLGFGMGNYKDSKLELLADRGNGNYAYIDDLREARKVLVEQIGGTLVTIAKDVKIQVEFNPAEVAAYKLIGYENRMLRKEDFNDDTKDAGEIGAGVGVTALYEIVPAGSEPATAPPVDPLKYQATASATDAAKSGELFTLKLRYKEPDGDASKLLSFPVADSGRSIERASVDFKFAAAVADFGLMLRAGNAALAAGDGVARVSALATQGVGRDPGGYRAEFLALVSRASGLR